MRLTQKAYHFHSGFCVCLKRKETQRNFAITIIVVFACNAKSFAIVCIVVLLILLLVNRQCFWADRQKFFSEFDRLLLQARAISILGQTQENLRIKSFCNWYLGRM